MTFAPLLPPVHLPPLSNLPNLTPPLPQLAHDELILQHRKSHIRSFGSRWLLPPGVSKTLQGLADERTERAETEAAAAAQEAQAHAQAQQDMMEMQREGEEGGEVEGEEEEEMGMGEDLDREVVDMDEAVGSDELDSNEEGDDEAEEAQWADSPSSLPLQSSYGAANPPLPPNGLGTDIDLMGVDLDGDIPSAAEDEGSYQHTDTDVEDESSAMFSVADGIGGERHGNVLDSSVFGREVPSPPTRRVVDASGEATSSQNDTSAVAVREAALRRASGRRGGGRENLRGSFG